MGAGHCCALDTFIHNCSWVSYLPMQSSRYAGKSVHIRHASGLFLHVISASSYNPCIWGGLWSCARQSAYPGTAQPFEQVDLLIDIIIYRDIYLDKL